MAHSPESYGEDSHGLPATAAIALGSNLGDSSAILELAVKRLNQLPGLMLLSVSSVYQTAAVGPPQPDYLNACALFHTELSPLALMEVLLSVEQEFGRVRRERWGPRVLDLDLLLVDQIILNTPTLQLPHPRMRERAFVLIPLAEIAPHWIDPISGKAIADLAQAVDCSGVAKITR